MRRLLMTSAVFAVAGGLAGCEPASEETPTAPAVVEQGPLDDAIAAEDLPPDEAIPAEEDVPAEAAPPSPDEPVGPPMPAVPDHPVSN